MEFQSQNFAGGAAKLGRVGAIFVREEFEGIEMDQSIADDEMFAIAPGGFARSGAGEFDEGKSRQRLSFFEPHIRLDFTTSSLRGVDRGQRFERQAFPLVVSVGEGDGVDFCDAENFGPRRRIERQWIEDHPAVRREDGGATTFAADIRVKSMPDGKPIGDPIQLRDRLHTSKKSRIFPRNPAL